MGAGCTEVTQKALFVERLMLDYMSSGHMLMANCEILNPALRESDQLFESICEGRGR